MADPTWIKKTTVLSLAFALPALVLLAQDWRNRSTRPSPVPSAAWWIGLALVVSYFCWFLNVTFEWSVGLMIAWPLFGMVLALLGCGLSFFADGENRPKLLIANALLLVLGLLSIVAPN
jgi:drug/metabolite transporter (DMT)-like permease